jgi:hypothetical protein
MHYQLRGGRATNKERAGPAGRESQARQTRQKRESGIEGKIGRDKHRDREWQVERIKQRVASRKVQAQAHEHTSRTETGKREGASTGGKRAGGQQEARKGQVKPKWSSISRKSQKCRQVERQAERKWRVTGNVQLSTANLARGGATFLNLNLLSDERNVSLRSPI